MYPRIVSSQKRDQGAALVTTLVISGILFSALVGYLALVSSQTKMGMRSQAWNLTMAIAEAGVEEGLEQLNSHSGNMAVQGWSYNGSAYTITRTLSSGNSYTVYITNGTYPVIISTATVNNLAFAQNGNAPGFMAVAGVSSTATTISRTVKVVTSKGNLFTKAMVAKNTINMNGNNVTVDSFDSSNPSYSTSGLYDSTKRKDGGDVASNSSVANSVSVGNANIYGHVATGAGGTVYTGPNGGVGSIAWQASNSGQQTNWVTHDSNFTFPSISLPANYNTYLTPQPGVVTNYSTSVTTGSATVSTYPSPVPAGGVTTNTSSSTVSIYPNPVPAGLTTNTISTTSSNLPSPIPAGTTTNTSSTTTASLPSPLPSGSITTNTTAMSNQSSMPAAGTYVGTVTITGPSNNRKYAYNKITDYTYLVVTGYTYPTYTYSYPTYTYSYTTYTTNTTYTTTAYTNILTSGNYVANALTGTTLVTGDATLVLPNGMNLSQNLTINSSGSLTIYVDKGTNSTGSISIAGNNVVNQNGTASKFVVYATDNITSFSLSGNGSFTGVLVAGNADVSLNGGGNNTVDFIGAIIMNTITMNGHFNFHYDEALKNVGGNGRYLPTSWAEVY